MTWLLRGFAVAFFALLALVTGSWGTLVASRAFGGYPDSAPSMYFAIGVGGILLALLFAGVAALLAVGSGSRRWTAVLVGSVAALLVPYPVLFGPLAYAVYVPLLGAAVLAFTLREA